MGTLRIKGQITLAQYWPNGTSDADTTQLEIEPVSFEFASDDITFKKTDVFNGAFVIGRSGKKGIIRHTKTDDKDKITLRLQGIDAPELHYRGAPLAGNKYTTAQKSQYKKANGDFRQPYGEYATYELGKYMSSLARGKANVDAVIISKNVHEPSDALDTFGRFVSNIEVAGVDINLWLVEQGWALPTFYNSMDKSEIEAVLTAEKIGKKKRNTALANMSYECSGFDSKLVFQSGKNINYVQGSDQGLVLIPKFFRRLVNYSVLKKAKLYSGSFTSFMQNLGAKDTFYLKDEYFKHGHLSAVQYKIGDHIKNGKFDLPIEDVLFVEGQSEVVDSNGDRIKSF